MVTVAIPWLAATGNAALPLLTANWAYNINLLAQWQSGKFTTIQAVWVDNSTCPYAVRLTCAESAQSLLVPAFTQGLYPLLVQQAPVFTVTLIPAQFGTSLVLACTTTLIFTNVPQRYYVQTLPLVGSQNAALNTPISNTPTTTVLAVPTGAAAGRRYVINSLSMYFIYTGTFAAPWAKVVLQDAALGTSFWEDGAAVPVGAAASQTLWYARSFQFQSPLVLAAGGGAVQLVLNNNANPGTLAGSITIEFGIVTIA